MADAELPDELESLARSPEENDQENWDNDAELTRLRHLLLAPEQEEIRQILARFDNPSAYAKEVSEILPSAISISTSQGPDLERALAPTLESATRRAIEKDTKSFADALFPIMGPAIRKAITEALRGLVQSLNQALEHSLSIRGLKWRIEAIRTGRSFGEVALSHTLVYRVEQIFLIHRETGLLLQHVVAAEVQAEDADMVSGMLTAIQDFVRDSFKMDQGETLQTMEVGDLQVWVEAGPRASLAAAIRGNAPVELRRFLRETLEKTHVDMADDLAEFEGDADPFLRCRPLLEECIQSRKAEEETGTSLLFKVIVGAGLSVILWWLVSGWLFQRNVEHLVKTLRNQPGIVVTTVEVNHNKATIRGLRDPLAAPTDNLLDQHELKPGSVRFQLQPYQALHDPFILQRVRSALDPPPEIELSFTDGALVATGAADDRWRSRTREIALVLAGVTSFDDSDVVRPDSSEAVRRRLESLAKEIESHFVSFAVASAEIDAANLTALEPVAASIRTLLTTAEESFLVVRVKVEGYADPTGPAELNTRLSRDRAQAVVDTLTDSGIPEQFIQPVGRGTLVQSEEPGDGVAAERPQRRVEFSVELPDSGEDSDR